MLERIVAIILAALLAAAPSVVSSTAYPGPVEQPTLTAEATSTPVSLETPTPADWVRPTLVYQCVGYITTERGDTICAGWWVWGDGTPVPPTNTPAPPTAYP